ncbi:MAG: hypothetical protein D8H98_04115 [Prevotella sp.]|jgi:hypothetical protein|uniref:hypothetical protein n=1 Tax=Hoylesella loescheii TaxID=840 RepID=UPI000F1BCBA6|nr:hypothetical protein [Hoylesella loescheii]RKW62110.1 MAG: hypothetical protein D8H98_04115 [Prevotella sp.]
MRTQVYTKPYCVAIHLDLEELLKAPGASRFDNDGDGNSDQNKEIPHNPDEIGAKPNYGWDWDE